MNHKKNIQPHLFLAVLAILVFALATTANAQYTITVEDGVPVRVKGGGFLEDDPSYLVTLKVYSSPLNSMWVGSGAFITDRLILTCGHNVQGMKPSHKISVHTVGGETYKSVSVVHADQVRDLALLSVNDLKVYPHKTLTISNETSVTGVVYTQGFDPSVDALVSGKGKMGTLQVGIKGRNLFNTCDSYIIQGMSGGPSVNSENQLVGINIGKHPTFTLITMLTEIHDFLDESKQ